MELKQLTETRNSLIAQAGVIANNSKATSEDRSKVKKMFTEIDSLQEQIDIAKRFDVFAEENRSAGRPPRGQPGEHQLDATPEKKEVEKRAFADWMKGRLKPEDRQYLRTEIRDPETRDLTVGASGATTGGGVLVPIGYDPQLNIALKSFGEILGAVRILNTDTGEGLRVSLTNDTSEAVTVLGEATAAPESDPPLTGFTSYTDTLTSGLIRVSNQLIQDSAWSVDDFLTSTIMNRFYRGASNMVTSGNGSNITSIVAGATVGYTTPTGTTTAIPYLSLVDLYASLDPAYVQNASFVMNNTTWASLMALTDSYGRPLLQTDLNGTPFRSIFGRPILLAQAMANVAAGTSPILFGDLKAGYTFRQAGQTVVRKTTDRFFEYNETAFASFSRCGGYSTNAGTNPIVSLKMATS